MPVFPHIGNRLVIAPGSDIEDIAFPRADGIDACDVPGAEILPHDISFAVWHGTGVAFGRICGRKIPGEVPDQQIADVFLSAAVV